ncbi:flagellar protein FlaG [Desulfosporosinus sp. PR]|uniref:flagellar protein FlaG n=1 Tax=Candidatus Desulfosporosinus nitrosoreducens TaxID=3401928 RepID=UPI0027F3B936|nr:flagellar protein FlaG [Desulfosporosinus sp. PR]MDQ7096262.1 flagellar protein FlaG [Desulfosporosinus sp. PR]
MFNPIQPNTQTTIIPMDAFPGQKLERSQENPRPVVDRKQEIPSAREEIPREEVEKAAEKMNRLMGIMKKRLKFSVNKKSRQGFMIKIIDETNGEVLEEITPERMLEIFNSFNQKSSLIFDEQV